ncbi:tubulin-specific chaperone E [Hemiscyllium ocellatum]|uniref:tubulin-specific chaperone E n=1 Tax=Hemiscyllium ocellatum TaxID=170820 RepID=UPI0029671249|nr:tubulin-specific chaperone E [Hemiscyllium ocellatum]XP_060708625.1 tubulin-specific chaperone E [Hemiscyllium ocellatum]
MTQSDSVPCDAVGRRIIYRDEYGTVRFVGTVPSAPGIWLGVEWDNPERGKHNGTHEGVQYFQCSHPTGGSFIRPQKANFGVDFLTAVRDRYGQEGNQGIQDCRGNPLLWGKKPIEFLGSQDVKQRWFDALLVVSVSGCQVSHVKEEEEISEVCPNIIELDLAKNLLASWDKVAQITRQLRKLEHLDLSQNKLAIISNPVSLSDAFANLKALAIQHNGLTWAQVLECAPMWPVLERAHFASNAISELERPVGVLQSLTLLDLSSNPLADENQLVHIAYLPRLEQLILSNTGLTSLHFDDVQQDGKTAMFPKLKFLAIDKNQISEFSTVNELNKLQSLEQLKFSDYAMVEREKNAKTVRQLIIAKLGRLSVLNKTEISADERKGAELDYRKKFGMDWLKAGGHQDPEKNRPNKEFCAEHPRYQSLIEKFGPPEVFEMEQQKLFALKDQLLVLTIRCPDNPDQKLLEKKLPDSMTIQKVRGLLHRLLKIPGAELKLTYISSKMDVEIDMDNDLKPLSYYSIESGDCILVRW